MKYYLSRWFSIFQWLTGTHILAGIFLCCEEGTCRAVLNMAGETHFTHVLHSNRVIFHQYSNICALSDVLCLCSQVQSAASSQAVSRPEENIIVDSVKFILILRHCSCKKKKEKHHTAAGIFFSCLLGSLKWAQLYVSLQQLSADCVTSVFCFFIMSFSLAAFSVWENQR